MTAANPFYLNHESTHQIAFGFINYNGKKGKDQRLQLSIISLLISITKDGKLLPEVYPTMVSSHRHR